MRKEVKPYDFLNLMHSYAYLEFSTWEDIKVMLWEFP
jgi:hypothetical protein